MQKASRVLVYGGAGQLGRNIISNFLMRHHNGRVISVDVAEAGSGIENIRSVVVPKQLATVPGTQELVSQIKKALKDDKENPDAMLDAVICVAGGWTGGNAADGAVIESVEKMYQANVLSAIASAHIASSLLKTNGLLVFTGSAAALQPTPGMLGYGMAKAATHHLVSSLVSPGSGLPSGVTVAAILPATLDTQTNRDAMPGADRSSWTPLDHVSHVLIDWIEGIGRPKNGALLALQTKGSTTTIEEH